MLYGSTLFSDNTLFTHNSASRNGGALCLIGTNITVRDTVNIASNSARNGGAMYLESGAFFTISDLIKLNIFRNSASEYGGAILSTAVTLSSYLIAFFSLQLLHIIILCLIVIQY